MARIGSGVEQEGAAGHRIGRPTEDDGADEAKESAVATDQPGWRPDPEQPGMVRWWNGLGWSDARRKADQKIDQVRAAADDALRGSTITPQEVARTVADRRSVQGAPAAAAAAGAVGASNPFAVAGLGLGIIGFGFGLYGVLSLIGLIVSLVGLARARRLAGNGERRTGLGQSLAGLVVSAIGLLRWIPVVLGLLMDAAPDLFGS